MSSLHLSARFHNYLNVMTDKRDVLDASNVFKDSIAYIKHSQHFVYILFADESSAIVYDLEPKLGILSTDVSEEPFNIFLELGEEHPEWRSEIVELLNAFLADLKEHNAAVTNG